jgi:exopolysaccharide biosynthesis polyprenyl glycosylphosphotransferase
MTTVTPAPAGHPADSEPGSRSESGHLVLEHGKLFRSRGVEGSPPPLSVNAVNSKMFLRLCRAADPAVALIVLLAVFVLSNADSIPYGLPQFLEVRLSVRNVLILVAFTVLWRVLCSASGLYDWRQIRSRRVEAGRVLLVCTIGGISAFVFPVVSKSGAFGQLTVVYFWAALVLAMLGSRLMLRLIAAARAAREIRDVVIVGSGPRALQVFRELQAHPAAVQVLGFVDTNQEGASAEIAGRLLGPLEELEAILMRRPIDEVLITLPIRSRYSEIQAVIDLCERIGVPTRHLADVFRANRPWKPLEELDRRYVLAMRTGPDEYRLLIKRSVDIVLGTVGLVLASPILLAAAISVRLSGSGPVIFSQPRFGLNRRPFRMYKFRTMVADAEALQVSLEERNEAAGPVFKIRDDPRVTRVGRFLRHTSIDELPQLVNVILGDMSLVGPRPLPLRDVERFGESTLMRRFSVRPGLTCLWQISGRSNVDFARWIALDLNYIDNWSLSLDLAILARTIPVVLRGTGAV